MTSTEATASSKELFIETATKIMLLLLASSSVSVH
jgi:hypothetical protein